MSWLRDHATILIWTAAIVFTVPFVAGTLIRNFMGPQGPRGTLATVNGRPIPVESYQNLYDEIRNNESENQSQPITPDRLDALRRRAFKQAVNQALMQQTLGAQGAGATESEIRQMFLQNPTFRNEQGRINRRAVQRVLQRLPEQRRQQIERSTRRRIESFRMSQWLSSHVDTTDTESRVLMEAGLRQLDLYGIYLDPRTFVDQKRVRNYYEQNREQYRSPPRAFVRHILLRADTGTRQAPGRLNEIKKTIQTIRRRYQAGDSFEQLAREFSDDTSTAQNGGALGWVTPDDLHQSFSNEVFGGDTGTLTNLIRTDRGYHLAMVAKGPEISYKDISEVETSIRKKLLSDTHWTQARREIKQIRRRITNSTTPMQKLQEIALVQSQSNFASDRAGYYGWVPVSFVLSSRHSEASNWRGELTQGNRILQPISNTLAELETGRVSSVVRSEKGFHLFMAESVRQGDVDTLSDTNTRRLQLALESQKKSDYQKSWLRKKRKDATIELNVPKSRIGGFIPWKRDNKK